jgi:23S rRNA (uridine2552-2'-O)-methyltransferase
VSKRKGKSQGHWRQSQREDLYFQRAKQEGYRARSAYKLQQIQERFGILRRGQAVLDLGAAPGSWSQVAIQIVGSAGKVIAVDLQAIEPIPGVVTLQGDLTAPEVQAQIVAAAGGPLDVVLSDAAPNVSGIHLRDHVLSVELVRAALALARQVLKPGGHLVAKVFEGEDLPQLIADLRLDFDRVKPNYPAATRREGREVFLVCTGLKKVDRESTLPSADTA